MDIRDSNGSKVSTGISSGVVQWECSVCGTSGKARINNWNSPRARTCCGGRFAKNRDRLLVVWTDMNSRCTDPNHPAYERYRSFGKPSWNSYEEFSAWAMSSGWEYGLDIDRTDNSKGYSPENCKFVTRQQNSRNRSSNRVITAFGETKTLQEWEEDPRSSVQAQSIAARLDRYGWTDVELAISTPSR